VNSADAEIVALKAIEWMAADGTVFTRFLNESGETADSVQRRLGDAVFLAAAMDHILLSDDAVVAFCTANNLSLELPAAARRALPGGGIPEWT